MLALSSHYDILVNKKGISYSYLAKDKVSQYSSQQYGKAIKRIIRILDNQANFRETLSEILMTCLLLVSYELLRGCGTSALTHLDGAIYLCSLPAVRSRNFTLGSLSSADTVLTAMDSIERAFLELELQEAAFVGARIPRLVLSRPYRPTNSPCSSLMEARDSLCAIEVRVFQFIRHVATKWKYYKPKPMSPIEDFQSDLCGLNSAIDERNNLLGDLQEWESSFEAFIKEISPSNLSSSRHFASDCHRIETNSTLLLSFLTTFIMLSTSLEQEEATYDLFFVKFTKIVTLAEEILARRFLKGCPSNCSGWERKSFDCSLFQLDTRVIFPLYFTALKCRDHRTRVHSLSLLRRSGREGAWDGELMALVAERVIICEEATARVLYNPRFDEGKCFEDSIQGPETIPEFARVHGTSIDLDRGRIKLSCSRRIPLIGDATRWEHLKFTLLPRASDIS
ncbi:hypothetical protein BDV23DRAFT_186658 [Aspergillus alliaceus]|uniref:Uncharacterized protein n=1 Tax=Petromyces alliaceus TaxID=209559 RepID=A0A5N7BZ23_PETAA|nr:hypothetical protein BDV23DRAFT_186658 [Aspergillus alliaceus]